MRLRNVCAVRGLELGSCLFLPDCCHRPSQLSLALFFFLFSSWHCSHTIMPPTSFSEADEL